MFRKAIIFLVFMSASYAVFVGTAAARAVKTSLPFLTADKKVFLIDLPSLKEANAGTEAIIDIEGPGGPLQATALLSPKYSKASGSYVISINLSQLTAVGKYHVTVPAFGTFLPKTSFSFSIAETNQSLTRHRNNAWNAFYWITDGPLGPYNATHLQDLNARVFDAPDETRDVRGGWFDAGDYGKYAVNGAHSLSLMLLTGLHAPKATGHKIEQLAGENTSQPDWLDVAESELTWLLKMQAEDGGVNHKATSKKFPSMNVSPQADRLRKWVMPTTSTTTANFAAVMNLAALIFAQQNTNEGFEKAERFKEAAKKAQHWLALNPNLKMIKQSYNGYQYGGPYHDDNDDDERFFALATTAVQSNDFPAITKAMNLARQRAAVMRNVGAELDWRSVDLLGFWALKLIEHKLSTSDAYLVNSILKFAANEWGKAKSDSPWRIAQPDNAPMNWGSNGELATRGWHWHLWAKTGGEQRFAIMAQDQLNWFFGRNPLNKVFVTGDGTRAVKAPHFRPWTSGAINLPNGLLVGGANSGKDSGDEVVERLSGRPPMRIYADDMESFATNEVAINWQTSWALYLSLAHDYQLKH